MPMQDKIYFKNPDFVQREVANEFLLIPIRRRLSDVGSLFVLNDTGAAVWRLFDGNRTVRQIQAELVNDYEAPAEQLQQDLETLILDLLSIEAVQEKSV